MNRIRHELAFSNNISNVLWHLKWTFLDHRDTRVYYVYYVHKKTYQLQVQTSYKYWTRTRSWLRRNLVVPSWTMPSITPWMSHSDFSILTHTINLRIYHSPRSSLRRSSLYQHWCRKNYRVVVTIWAFFVPQVSHKHV